MDRSNLKWRMYLGNKNIFIISEFKNELKSHGMQIEENIYNWYDAYFIMIKVTKKEREELINKYNLTEISGNYKKEYWYSPK